MLGPGEKTIAGFWGETRTGPGLENSTHASFLFYFFHYCTVLEPNLLRVCFLIHVLTTRVVDEWIRISINRQRTHITK